MKANIKDFVKKNITFNEKLTIINDWEEDRCSDGEFIYDLDDDADAESWIELYSAETLHKCRKEGRYWLGGWQFGCNGKNIIGNCSTAWCITESKIDDFLNDILGEIDDRFADWIKENKPKNNEEKIKAAIDFASFYSNLIDFKAYSESNMTTKYKWVAVSNDESYRAVSDKIFHTKESCYNDMRDHALEKMKWNTELSDIDCDESYIHYEVNFYTNKITHQSYSGYYVYEIVPYDTKTDNEFFKAFAQRVADELNGC